MSANNRFQKFSTLFFYLIVIILLNIVSLTFFYRIDLTGNKIYSLSKLSKKVVSTLSEPLTINVFFSKDLPAPHNNTERYLHDLLEEYAINSNNYFNFRFYDVSRERDHRNTGAIENQKIANNYGIYPVQIQAVEKDEVKFIKAYMGLVMIHGDIIERIPTITSIDGLEYKLTTTIQKLNNKISALLSLPEKIKIKLFVSSSLIKVAHYMGLDEKQLSEFPNKFEDVIKEINKKNYDKLEYTFIDPSKDKISEFQMEQYQLMYLKWPALSEGQIEAGSASIGLVMEYDGNILEAPILKVLRIPMLGTQYRLVDINQMEDIINANVESLVDINEDIGFLADHGTLGTTGTSAVGLQQGVETLNSFKTLASQTYTLEQINLKKDEIPDTLNSLMIARPTEPFSDYELYQIDQALMRGTNIIFFLDSFYKAPVAGNPMMGMNPGSTYIPVKTGLEKLLNNYGIKIQQSIVMDKNCFKQQQQGSEVPVYYAPLIKETNINPDIDFMKNIKGLVAIKMSPLDVDFDLISDLGLKATNLFSSSKESWEMKKITSFNPFFISPPTPQTEMKSMNLAYLIEGEFTSFFKDKPMPEKPNQEDEPKIKIGPEQLEKNTDKVSKPGLESEKIEERGTFLEKGKPAKIFLMASSEMLRDNIIDAEGKNTNAMLIMNILDYMNGREKTIAMRSKEQRFNPLYEISSPIKFFTKTFNIAGLPIIVVIFGIFVWIRHNTRKKQIQMIFEK